MRKLRGGGKLLWALGLEWEKVEVKGLSRVGSGCSLGQRGICSDKLDKTGSFPVLVFLHNHCVPCSCGESHDAGVNYDRTKALLG